MCVREREREIVRESERKRGNENEGVNRRVGGSVSRRLYIFSNIWPFVIMKISQMVEQNLPK